MAPAGHHVDGIRHRELQLGGALAGSGGIILTGEGREAQLASVPEVEDGRARALPGPGPTHLLTLAIRRSRSPSSALGETSKVAVKVI